ncbi:hypothetical protein OOK12_23140 [Streptomyces sp. NBC_00452]|uniref:hypothetical protein n=1 Tax=Streptomyces sp. NBC_00452 TaxID=2975746 RepID=UPI002254CA71|nr:hypothetical protein [Streptomyces sp. NBC_00452]MCX5059871.1 hypothetical protein [Streptomyces sp. NBC_00452]
MTDVVDSDELLRRIRRARDCAQREQRAWRTRGEGLRATDPEAAHEAAVRTLTYEAVLCVLDEILTPGKRADGT